MKPEHYFTERPKSPAERREITATIGTRRYTFITAGGTFSATRIDRGTQALIEHMQLPERGTIVDLGCGWGAIGIVAAAERPHCKVIMADINKRAVACAKQNVKMNRVANAEARVSDGFEKIPEIVDAVLFNPPFTAGKNVVDRLVNESFRHLHPGGSLQVVARSKKGGRSLSERMAALFGSVETIGRSAGYHVYFAKKT
jgi:16S rRNA (guanine1207-N2)-methyltransferase